jgi:2-dehydro-3-deoxyphosphogluconate aldolase/(4S)-4-hydroxy-2-oxoglutarate aldolase
MRDLRGPYPEVRLVPSGGVNAGNAREFLDQGAFAVCCGTDVVPPDAVARGDIGDVSRRAAHFAAALAERSG